MTNVRKERGGGKKQSVKNRGGSRGGKGSKAGSKNRLYDIENLSLSYSFNEIFNRNIKQLIEHGIRFNNIY